MKKETIYLAGGCFWGTEKYMRCVEGVLETRVGYALGEKPLWNPPLKESVTYGGLQSQRTRRSGRGCL